MKLTDTVIEMDKRINKLEKRQKVYSSAFAIIACVVILVPFCVPAVHRHMK